MHPAPTGTRFPDPIAMLLRRFPFLLLAAVTLVACNSDRTGRPPANPGRSLLDGEYTCAGFEAYTIGDQGPGYYGGSCTAYLTFADPALADSGRTYPFIVNTDNTVSRLDYPEGAIAYDSTAVVAVISYPGFPQDIYNVAVDNVFTYFEQKLVFDFSGDGQTDTLYLVFTNRR